MTEMLESPFTLGVFLLIVLAWILMLLAIFWPRRHERHNRF
ncbi:MAG TPA: hypothetical protein VGM26_16445 [Rhizomicrobium sp.]|jgi:hypothetical protein